MGGGEDGRPSDSVVQARRSSRPQTMTALANASQNATTSRRRSVHQRSLPYWLPQAWVRSTGQRRPAWTGAGMPRVAIWPIIPRSARTCRHGFQS